MRFGVRVTVAVVLIAVTVIVGCGGGLLLCLSGEWVWGVMAWFSTLVVTDAMPGPLGEWAAS